MHPFFMSNIVNGVVAVQLAHRNRAFGTVIFAQGLAMAALAPVGGAGADRWLSGECWRRRIGRRSRVRGLPLLLAFDSLTIPGLAIGVHARNLGLLSRTRAPGARRGAGRSRLRGNASL
jgi:hypothetical protein